MELAAQKDNLVAGMEQLIIHTLAVQTENVVVENAAQKKKFVAMDLVVMDNALIKNVKILVAHQAHQARLNFILAN